MPSARSENDALKAQLVQALASVTQLTQQNAMLIEQMNILQRQMQEEREERIQMQRMQREMDLRRELMYRQTDAMAIDRHSPKRARDPEGGEPRLPAATATQSTSGSGNPGVQAAVSREGQDVNEEGYETLTFINNTGTRYSHWLCASNATRPRAYGSTTISDPFERQANLEEAISPCRRWYEPTLYANAITNSDGWDPGPPIGAPPIHPTTHFKITPSVGAVNTANSQPSHAGTNWQKVPAKRVIKQTDMINKLHFTYPSASTAHEAALRPGSPMAPGQEVHLHWIRRCSRRGAMRHQ